MSSPSPNWQGLTFHLFVSMYSMNTGFFEKNSVKLNGWFECVSVIKSSHCYNNGKGDLVSLFCLGYVLSQLHSKYFKACQQMMTRFPVVRARNPSACGPERRYETIIFSFWVEPG